MEYYLGVPSAQTGRGEAQDHPNPACGPGHRESTFTPEKRQRHLPSLHCRCTALEVQRGQPKLPEQHSQEEAGWAPNQAPQRPCAPPTPASLARMVLLPSPASSGLVQAQGDSHIPGTRRLRRQGEIPGLVAPNPDTYTRARASGPPPPAAVRPGLKQDNAEGRSALGGQRALRGGPTGTRQQRGPFRFHVSVSCS